MTTSEDDVTYAEAKFGKNSKAAQLLRNSRIAAKGRQPMTCMSQVASSVLRMRWRLPPRGVPKFRLHRIALALLERGVDPAGRFLTPLLEPEDLYAQLARQKLHRLVTQKPQNDLTLARHRPSLAKSQRACRQSLAWGKRGRAKLARIYHRPINSNFLLKIIGHVPVLLGHFD